MRLLQAYSAARPMKTAKGRSIHGCPLSPFEQRSWFRGKNQRRSNWIWNGSDQLADAAGWFGPGLVQVLFVRCGSIPGWFARCPWTRGAAFEPPFAG